LRTGEGKTQVATLPAYLNALEGKALPMGFSCTQPDAAQT